ncbi:hypothetical protein JXC34_06175 [Candidatus Woesearchaeota archaeon]|nr:hypothetical protein [Candidatus Woesearchaeota archaeon]
MLNNRWIVTTSLLDDFVDGAFLYGGMLLGGVHEKVSKRKLAALLLISSFKEDVDALRRSPDSLAPGIRTMSYFFRDLDQTTRFLSDTGAGSLTGIADELLDSEYYNTFHAERYQFSYRDSVVGDVLKKALERTQRHKWPYFGHSYSLPRQGFLRKKIRAGLEEYTACLEQIYIEMTDIAGAHDALLEKLPGRYMGIRADITALEKEVSKVYGENGLGTQMFFMCLVPSYPKDIFPFRIEHCPEDRFREICKENFYKLLEK